MGTFSNLFRRKAAPGPFEGQPPDALRRATSGRSPVEIGRFTYGHEGMAILEWGEGAGLKIGAFCSIAEGVTVMLGGNHRTDWITTFPFGHIHRAELGGEGIAGHPQSRGDVVIGNDVWIGRGATILSGVTLADGTVIAANATVAKDTGPYEIWGGNPATFRRKRFPEEVIAALLALRWWDQPAERIRAGAPLLSAPPTPENLALLREWAEAGR